MTPADDELIRLRDWRHDVAMPAIVAAREQIKQLAADCRQMSLRLDEMELRIERMARADEIAEAIQEHSRGFRRGFLNAWERGLIVAAAVVGAIGVLLQLVH